MSCCKIRADPAEQGSEIAQDVCRPRPEEQVSGVGRKYVLGGGNKICKGPRSRKGIMLLRSCRVCYGWFVAYQTGRILLRSLNFKQRTLGNP